MTWTDETLSTGRVIDGRYTIEALIGIGGMGAVYRAQHEYAGRVMAVKVLHPHLACIPVMLKRFQREARAAGAVSHDNVCEINDTGSTEDGLSFLVMPYLRGVTLGDVLSLEELSLKRLLELFIQLLRGLQAIHTAQIVHRDLKPDNVLITRAEDGTDRVRILDFGISKCLADDEGLTGLTAFGSVLGTPHYMAPEQARGSKDVGGRADIYAAGVMLYEALTGERPHQGETGNDVMYQLLNNPFTHPAVLNPKIPADLNTVVLKALDKNPEGRYSSAAMMADELEALSESAQRPDQIVSVRRRPNTPLSKDMQLSTTRAEAPVDGSSDTLADAGRNETVATRVRWGTGGRRLWAAALFLTVLLGSQPIWAILLT